jgi:hypothetical protein
VKKNLRRYGTVESAMTPRVDRHVSLLYDDPLRKIAPAIQAVSKRTIRWTRLPLIAIRGLEYAEIIRLTIGITATASLMQRWLAEMPVSPMYCNPLLRAARLLLPALAVILLLAILVALLGPPFQCRTPIIQPTVTLQELNPSRCRSADSC